MFHQFRPLARASVIVLSCAACAGGSDAPAGAGGGGGQSTLPASGGAGPVSGAAGNSGSNGGSGSDGGSDGGSGGTAGVATPMGGTQAGGTGGTAGSTAGAAGMVAEGGGTASGGSGGSGGGQGGMAGTSSVPVECGLSQPVSFKKDIEPYLTASCGKAKGGGCHVTDNSSTSGSLCPDGTKTCGFDHAYDWITAGSHNEFCKQASTPLRFTVVLPVMKGAQPQACSKSRVMPPDGPPATACQLAAIEAWLALPKVVQMHRSDDTSPTEPYGMPPFN